MNLISSITELRAQIASWRQAKQRIALVPTMGNLHDGHISLVQHALTVADRVVVSIFVNPLQFGPTEDYQAYPRTLTEDSAKLQAAKTDLVFTPTVAEMYPTPMEQSTRIEVPHLSNILCGASRPGHFIGVATVVNKLFNLVQPDKAVFGEKDFQQLLIIKRMVTDLNLPIDLIGQPTYREPDGLAMSSRNRYLTTAQRQLAPQLFQMLDQLKRHLLSTGQRNFTELEDHAKAQLTATGFTPDYVTVRVADTLALPSDNDNAQELVILAAAWLGKTRLIDNVRIRFQI